MAATDGLTAQAARVASMPASVMPLATAGAAAAACLVVGLVDPTRTQLFPPCPFKTVTGGLDCPGCGATRAMHALLTGNLGPAFGYNALLMLTLPFLLWSWATWAVPAVAPGIRLPVLRLPAKVIYALAGVIVAWWVVRNIPIVPLTGLHSDR